MTSINFTYDGHVVPLPVGHVFREVSNYDGGLTFTSDGLGNPTTINESRVTGIGGAIASNKFKCDTNMFAEGVRVGDVLQISGSVSGNNGSYSILGIVTTTTLNDTVIIDFAGLTYEPLNLGFAILGKKGTTPLIQGLSTTYGDAGDLIVITGQNFVGTTGVTVDGVSSVFVLNSATQITVTLPSRPTGAFYDVVVITPVGSSNPLQVFYNVGPTVYDLSLATDGAQYMWDFERLDNVIANAFTGSPQTLPVNGLMAAGPVINPYSGSKSFRFTGVTGHHAPLALNAGNPAGTPWSVEFWVRLTLLMPLSPTYYDITTTTLLRMREANYEHITVTLDNNLASLGFNCINACSGNVGYDAFQSLDAAIPAAARFTLGVSKHVALVHDPAQTSGPSPYMPVYTASGFYYLYVDGVLVGQIHRKTMPYLLDPDGRSTPYDLNSKAVNQILLGDTRDPALGGRPTYAAYNQATYADIDDVAFYPGVALTPAQILDHRNNT